MKRAAFSLAAVFLTASVSFADLTTPFTAPPFKLGSSLIGQEGWEMRLPNMVGDGTAARLVAVRWDDYRTAALLNGASIKNAFPATTGSKVRIIAQVAFTFPSTGPDLAQARILIGGAPFGEIAFKCHRDGGVGFSDGTPKNFKVLVPITDLKGNSYYAITILVDYDSSTYDVSITGEKPDGSPLAFEEKAVPFDTQRKALQGVSLITSKLARTYLRQLLIESL
jgi:hypothetical protein